MERKKILRRAAFVGLAILASAVAVTVAATAVHLRIEEGRRGRVAEHRERLTQEQQAALDDVAKTLQTLPPDPAVVAAIQARHFQERPGVWLYVWATSNTGEFVFGVPQDAFARLNTLYDQHQETIARDNHFATRDQFLRTFLHHPRRIHPPQPSADEDRRRDGETGWWRFEREENLDDGGRPVVVLSSPVRDASGGTVGSLNLKLVDTREVPALARPRVGPWRGWDDVAETALVVAVFSLIWLWFLLPSWVYIDAQDRGVPRPLLWALLTLVGSVAALMVYLISRPDDGAELRCPECGKPLNGTRAGCPYCGTDLSAAFCAQCQYPLRPDWRFCPSCRGPVGPRTAPEGAPPGA